MFHQIVETRFVETLEASLQANGISWADTPLTKGGYRIYLDGTCKLSEDVASLLSRTTINTWLGVHLEGLIDFYAHAGTEPDLLYFGVGSYPTGEPLSPREFENQFRALVRYHTEELAGSIAARLSTIYPRPQIEISRIEVMLGAEANTDVYVIFKGEQSILKGLIGFEAPTGE